MRNILAYSVMFLLFNLSDNKDNQLHDITSYYLKETKLNMYISVKDNNIKFTHEKKTRWITRSMPRESDNVNNSIIYMFDNKITDHVLYYKKNTLILCKYSDTNKNFDWVFFDSTSLRQMNIIMLFKNGKKNDNTPFYISVDSSNLISLRTSEELKLFSNNNIHKYRLANIIRE